MRSGAYICDNIRKRSFCVNKFKLRKSWGNNSNRRLGLKIDNFQPNIHSIIRVPQYIEALKNKVYSISIKNKQIDFISTCIDHSFAQSSQTGLIYSWGSGESGKLG